MFWCLLLGFFLGVITTLIFVGKRIDGDLVVNIPDSEDEIPYLTSEWNKSIHYVMAKKNVRLKVVIRQLNTHK